MLHQLSYFELINFLDLKKGPTKDKILLEKFEANFKPIILKIIKRIEIIKNCIKYFIDFIS